MYSKSMKGFTLIEVLLATALLTLIMGAAMIPFVNLQVFQQQSQITSDMEQNLQYLLNIMDKEIRTGENPSGSGTNLEFTNQNGDTVTYEFTDKGDSSPNEFEKTVGGATVTNYGSTDGFEISEVEFNIQEQDDDNVGNIQSLGRVTVSITAESKIGRTDEETIHVQSTTIMRNR